MIASIVEPGMGLSVALSEGTSRTDCTLPWYDKAANVILRLKARGSVDSLVVRINPFIILQMIRASAWLVDTKVWA